MSVRINWDQRELDRVVDSQTTKFLQWIGLRGAAMAREITNELKAVDTSFFIHSITYNMEDNNTLWIGSFALEGPVEYALFILLGTSKMVARPILRIMLHRMKIKLRTEGIELN